jgi:hypothetical protein
MSDADDGLSIVSPTPRAARTMRNCQKFTTAALRAEIAAHVDRTTAMIRVRRNRSAR